MSAPMCAPLRALLIAALALGAAACSATPESCVNLCSELESCGMLPGPLGSTQPRRSAIEDCEARCGISTERSELARCFDTVSPPKIEPWCDRGKCSEAASCLRTALESDAMLGVGSVHVSAVDEVPDVTDDECPSLPANEPADLSFFAELCQPTRVLAFSDPYGGCEPYKVHPARFVLELVSDQLPSILVEDGDCGSIAGRPYVPNVPVGTYRTSVSIYGRDTSQCVLLEGALFHVPASSAVDATFWITDTETITLDDGTVVEQPILPTLCPESDAVRCRNGLDDDADGLIDCEDSDCEESDECDSDRGTDGGGAEGDTTNTEGTGSTESGTGTGVCTGSSTGGGM